ncbi:MAG: hypothetical protein R8G33_02525 [Gammaproteobacteria bacterium]|nr:hypothetical protein [Gammaproteobacteria bacterium]
MTAKYNSKYGIILGLALAWQAASYFSPNTQENLKIWYLISMFLCLYLTIRFLYFPYFKITATQLILFNVIFIYNIRLDLQSSVEFSVNDGRLYYQHPDEKKKLLIRKSSCSGNDWAALVNKVVE